MIYSYHDTSQQVYQNHIWGNNTLSEKRLFFLYSCVTSKNFITMNTKTNFKSINSCTAILTSYNKTLKESDMEKIGH